MAGAPEFSLRPHQTLPAAGPAGVFSRPERAAARRLVSDRMVMTMVNRLARWFEIVLEFIAGFLIVALTAVVLYSVFWRYLGGASPRWYDEVAAILLAWLTYYAAALAALKRGHIGMDSALMALPRKARLALAVVAELVVIAFFIVLAWTGMVVLNALDGMTLISLTWVPLQFTQSVIPVGAVLFIVAELLSMPGYFALVNAGVSVEQAHLEKTVAEVEKAIEAEGAGAHPTRNNKAGA
jgi:TRAP-type C4-dicarboxylate transport system permease small subunit